MMYRVRRKFSYFLSENGFKFANTVLYILYTFDDCPRLRQIRKRSLLTFAEVVDIVGCLAMLPDSLKRLSSVF